MDSLPDLTESLERFLDRAVLPHVDQWEAEGAPPLRQLVRQLGELGLIGLELPEAAGGLGLGFRDALAVSECLGAIPSAGLAAAIASHLEQAVPLLHACGRDSDKQRWLVPLIRGEELACTLPFDAEDAPAMRHLVPGAQDADILVLPGAVLKLAGRVDPVPHQLGLWAARMGDPRDVALPADCGARWERWKDGCRVREAARSLRWMERLIAETAGYVRQRQVFGKSLLQRQAVRLRLAELQTEIDSLRALCHHAAGLLDAGEHAVFVSRLAAGAQWKAARLQHRVADDCLQFWGGMGFMAESPTARCWRDGIHAAMARQAPLLTRVADCTPGLATPEAA